MKDDAQSAIQHYARAFKMALDPEQAMRCRHMIGVCYKMEGRFNEAIAELTNALGDAHDLVDRRAGANISRDRGACWAGISDFDKAFEDIDGALEMLGPDEPAYWATWGYRGRLFLLDPEDYSPASAESALWRTDQELSRMAEEDPELRKWLLYNKPHLAVAMTLTGKRRDARRVIREMEGLIPDHGSSKHEQTARTLRWLIWAPRWLILRAYRRNRLH